jgi:hypothetical protein
MRGFHGLVANWKSLVKARQVLQLGKVPNVKPGEIRILRPLPARFARG